MITLTLTEAAAFLKMHPEELRSRAKRGLIPAPKSAGAGYFSSPISQNTSARYMLFNGKRCE